jgi:hypothetical protein
VDILDIDKYRRMVGMLYLGGRNINIEMIREGHAEASIEYLKEPYKSLQLLETCSCGWGFSVDWGWGLLPVIVRWRLSMMMLAFTWYLLLPRIKKAGPFSGPAFLY